MDALDKYKKAWNNQENSFNRISENEIYKLAHSKSSSIVKWIFIIGILEFVILNSVFLFLDFDKANQEYEKLGMTKFVKYSNVFSYIVLIYFLVQFYLNYRDIAILDSTKSLMQKIIKTRKTVRNYVLFNLSFLLFIIVVMTVLSIRLNTNDFNEKQLWFFGIAMFFTALIAMGLVWLFYQLLYGILLKKLKRNYKELSKLDA
jgi:hypothetical protein